MKKLSDMHYTLGKTAELVYIEPTGLAPLGAAPRFEIAGTSTEDDAFSFGEPTAYAIPDEAEVGTTKDGFPGLFIFDHLVEIKALGNTPAIEWGGERLLLKQA